MQQIDDLNDFRDWLAGRPVSSPAAIQDLKLTELSSLITQHHYAGSLFLGCEIDNLTAGYITSTGGTVIPDDRSFQFAIHRSRLYTADELFAGFNPDDPNGYHNTVDYAIYREYLHEGKRNTRMSVSLARSLHDHSITEALDQLIAGRKVVAVMGGHGMERGDEFYLRIARIARQLTRDGFMIATGGGPGAMEAAHLGAYFSTLDDHQMQQAIEILRVRPKGAKPGKEYADADWLHRAMKVRDAFPLSAKDERQSASVGIPTWFYGHEPPAPFPTHIAKYFANSIREDGLLEIAHHGVIFSPGSAGTTQEIFQDAAQNHYGSVSVISPMILFGVEHWTKVRPVWPLLREVSQGHRYGEIVSLTDDEADVIEQIRTFDPAKYTVS